jgi:hypothetical protein
VTRPDKAALDSAIQQVNGLLTSAEGLGFTVSRAPPRPAGSIWADSCWARARECSMAAVVTGASGSSASTSTPDTSSGSAVSTVA